MDKIKRDQKCKIRYLTGPTGPSGDNNIRNAYLTTFNDGSEISVNPDSRIPINNEEINNNQLITLEKDNNVFNFNLSGYYKITFIVSSYPDFNSQVFDSNTDFVSIALKEVDGVYVLDAGSSDNTVQKLRDRGVFVLEKEISPWRFDKARNESLKLVPSDADICICLDLDEAILTTDLITVNHYTDNNKSRDSYLELLELSVEEDPLDDRNMHYLGREYMYYGMYDKCIDTLIKHLSLKRAVWKDARCASMRFIGRSYKNLGRINESRMWYKMAIDDAPYLKELYVEMGLCYH